MVLNPFKHFDHFKKDNKLWQECIEYIKLNCKNDSLYENYIDLDPEKYLYFNALLDNDKIISFGGVDFRPSKWGIEVARVLTRFWIHPDYRTKALTKWSDQSIRFTPLILEPQLNFLKNQDQVKIAMITREGKYKKSFLEICRLASLVSIDSFDIFPDRYNICKRTDTSDACFQMIALSSISDVDKYSTFKKLQKLGFLQTKPDEKISS
jgi:hypothetical protein